MTAIRDASFWDISPVAGILAASLVTTPLGKWLEPVAVAHPRRLYDLFAARTTKAIQRGVARVAEHDGQVIAAALWLPCSTDEGESVTPADDEDEFPARLGQIAAAADRPHLQHAHLQLAGLGVLARWRRNRIATRLFDDQQQLLAPPARCLLAVEGEAVAALGTRCGYRPHGAAVSLEDRVIVQMMVRTTRLPSVRGRNLTPSRFGNGRSRITASAVPAPTTQG